jgi:flavorubredoxin
MDHSGGMPATVARVKPSKLVASKMGAKALPRHFDVGMEITAVGDGATLSVGERTLTFIETRMLHWPDSMMTYVSPDKLLFSQDGFGMHLASSARFADEIDGVLLHEEAAKYYANILLLYSPLVLKTLGKFADLGVAIDVIAPDHGPIYRKDPGWILERYRVWAEQKPTMKAVIVYDTMWQSTAAMAKAIEEGLAAGGASTVVLPLAVRHRSDVMTELLDAGALVVGTPTMNGEMFPTVADFLTYARGLKPAHLVGAAFGSYGWGGGGAGKVATELEAMKVELVAEPLQVNYVPHEEDLARCRELGEAVAARLRKTCGE